MKILTVSITVCVAQSCQGTCSSYYKGICRQHRGDNTCKSFCTERFGKVCEAKCTTDDNEVVCECVLPADKCPINKN